MPAREYMIYYTTFAEPDQEHCSVFKSFHNSEIMLTDEFKRYMESVDERVNEITSIIPIDRSIVAIVNGQQLHYDPVLSGYQV